MSFKQLIGTLARANILNQWKAVILGRFRRNKVKSSPSSMVVATKVFEAGPTPSLL